MSTELVDVSVSLGPSIIVEEDSLVWELIRIDTLAPPKRSLVVDVACPRPLSLPPGSGWLIFVEKFWKRICVTWLL